LELIEDYEVIAYPRLDNDDLEELKTMVQLKRKIDNKEE
jgi:hypothetical protein